MITVDCHDLEDLKHELAVFVSDWVGAIPTMKIHEFILSPIDDEKLDSERVIKAIREFFASIGETANFGVLPKNDTILITALNARKKRDSKVADAMFACTHCGYVTQYEVLWQNHMKMHYL